MQLLTEEEAKSASIFDVVLPLPGVSVTYPGNEIGDAYTATLAADGLDRARLETDCREYTLTGDYRLLMARPEDLEWSFVTYSDPRADLVQTDLTELRAKSRSLPANDDAGAHTSLRPRSYSIGEGS